MPKVVIKPIKGELAVHGIYRDGVLIARFKFNRSLYQTSDGLVRIKSDGWLEDLRTGEREDLSGYAWFKDIRRVMTHRYSKEG